MDKTATLSFVFIFYITIDLVKLQHIDSQKCLKTKWMTHLGCFGVNGLGDSTTVKMTNITNNQPKICSRQCGNWNLFALLGFKCFCFNEAKFKNLKEKMLNECHRECPDYTDKMYCGSEDMNYVNIYRLDKVLSPDVKEENFDCLTVNRHNNHTGIKQMPCDLAVSFICSGKYKPAEQKLAFKEAKQYCENAQHKLMNLNESLPQTTENNTYYWIGTFRQHVYCHESSVRPSTTARPVHVESTQHNYTQQSTTTRETTMKLDNMTTDRSIPAKTSSNLPTQLSTLFAKEDSVTQYGTMSKSVKSEDHHNDLNCGIFCVVLGIFSSCVSILVLLVCLFKIKEKWQVNDCKKCIYFLFNFVLNS
ncbi:uncharacterized protein LOC143046463 [Mytilus galloprovincialis]|uniref:uncharacterized protein LOC143046463 n=1 Tax=Mytilus galloprovincialis TaxID=29158 RepID=UPI003F7B4A7E